MEEEELVTIYGLLVVIRDRLRADVKDMTARGMVDELYDQLSERKADPEAVHIVSQLLMVRKLIALSDLKEMGMDVDKYASDL